MNRSKKIQMYLDKQMSDQEITNFEIELKNNPELYEELLLHKDVDSAIKDLIGESMFLKNLEQAHNTYMKTKSKNNSMVPVLNISRALFIKYAAAAVIFIMLSAGVYYMISPNTVSSDKLYLSYYSPYDVSGTNRSGNEELTTEVKAMQKFEQKDYAGAIKLFDELKNNESSNFYKGLAYLELNKPNEAIKSLQMVINNQNNELIADAEWYLGMAYLKANDTPNAKKQFTKVSEKYSYYKKKADEIISKLK